VATATDLAGNTSGPSSSVTVTVDTTAPDTTIGSGPPSPTSSHGATFAFSSNDGGATFECSLDGAVFAPCTSPVSYSGLAEGSHEFKARAKDAAGNVDPTPATHAWTIDSSAPETTIASGPSNPTTATDATFAFSSSEGGSTFECSLDGGAFIVCTSPATYSGLGLGSHTFEVRAIDSAGNRDLSPATYVWTIE
jgi:3-deoxy-D-arabino-heptulosonate 7-phosphate (DAHP) synthase